VPTTGEALRLRRSIRRRSLSSLGAAASTGSLNDRLWRAPMIAAIGDDAGTGTMPHHEQSAAMFVRIGNVADISDASVEISFCPAWSTLSTSGPLRLAFQHSRPESSIMGFRRNENAITSDKFFVIAHGPRRGRAGAPDRRWCVCSLTDCRWISYMRPGEIEKHLRGI
jgi:hypothetical protein